MNNRLYVGNLAFSITGEKLQDLFKDYGEVKEANLITDRATGRSKGFGFVEMATEEAANAAIEALNDTEIDGRNIKVNVAKERVERSGGGGFRR